MRKSLRNILILVAVLLALTVVYAWYSYTDAVDLGSRIVSIIIMPGDSFTSVAEKLIAEGVVKSKSTLIVSARLTGVDRKLTPGRYDFWGRNSCRSVLDKLTRADFVRVKVTIPEGTTIWKVASIVAEKLDLDSSVIVALNQDTVFLESLGLPCLEGYLFPETYIFPWGLSERDVVRQMVVQYREQTEHLWPDSQGKGMTPHEVMILASIIEAETKLDSERTLVSSVYYNRLRKAMRLQADPTVIYGLGGLDRPLYQNDLKKDTPYNTYLHKGLPPTPINSPGLAAIKAALNPDETDYLYFVANEAGGHYFSRTNAEHNRAKSRIKTAKQLLK
ncbi:MAG: endolytic transglycosylase MltG [Candidatus Zixiibacteriota bacterium]